MFLFDEQYANFEVFSMQHLAAILFFLVLIVLMIVFRNKISPKIDLYLRRSVAVLMISMEFIFYIWIISGGGFNLGLLPLGICAISMYATSIALWTKSEKLFKFIFPWAVTGSLLSLIVADMSYGFPHFRYLHYFGNHGFFLVGNLYFLIVLKTRFAYKDLKKSALAIFVYTLIIYPINYILDTNHLFLRALPVEVAPMYSFLGNFWVLGFMFSIYLLFNIIYFPLYLYNKKHLLSQTT